MLVRIFSPTRIVPSRLRPVRVALLAATVLVLGVACDSGGGPPPDRGPARAIVATIEGDTLRSFSLVSPAYPEPPYVHSGGRLVRVGKHFLFVRTSRHGRLYDLRSGAIVTQIPDSVDLLSSTQWQVTGQHHPDALVRVRQRTGDVAFADTIRLRDQLRRSSVRALRVTPSGDTTETQMFAFAVQKRDSTHFVTTQIRAAVPYGDGRRLLYVRDREVTTVTPRAVGDPVLNRFSFQRSLWRYNVTTDTHRRLRDLPTPDRVPPAERVWASASPDGTTFALHDERTYVVRIDGDSATCLNARCGLPSGDDTSSPILSPDGSRLLWSTRSCSSVYRVFDLVTGDAWRSFSSGVCADPLASWAPDGSHVYFVDDREGRAAVWRVPAGPPESEEGRAPRPRTLVLDVDARFALNGPLSRPVFLSPRTFVVLALSS